jgi:hypothetical protein
VSLEGTLETVSLPDVLALLSLTAKTGELRVESAGSGGSLWFEAGKLSGFDVSGQKSPVDALFALLRFSEGSFKFRTGTEVKNLVPPEDIAPLMAEAEARLAEWPSITQKVPSLSAELRLAPSIEAPVTLQPGQWQLLSAVGSGSVVAQVLAERGLSEFDGCKVLAELAGLGLVRVVGAAAGWPAEAPGGAAGAGGLPAAWERPSGVSGPGPGHQPGAPAPVSLAAGPDGNGRGGLLVKPVKLREDDEVVPPEAAGVAANKAPDLPEAGEEGPPGPEAKSRDRGEEAKQPVNRGLLLKFLGSARN